MKRICGIVMWFLIWAQVAPSVPQPSPQNQESGISTNTLITLVGNGTLGGTIAAVMLYLLDKKDKEFKEEREANRKSQETQGQFLKDALKEIKEEFKATEITRRQDSKEESGRLRTVLDNQIDVTRSIVEQTRSLAEEMRRMKDEFREVRSIRDEFAEIKTLVKVYMVSTESIEKTSQKPSPILEKQL